MRDSVPEGERVVAPPMENLKAAKWRLAVDVVAKASSSARFGSVPLPKPIPGATPSDVVGSDGASGPQSRFDLWSLESRLHAVESVTTEGKGRLAGLISIRFIFRNKLTRDDRLLVAFDALVLSELLGRDVDNRGQPQEIEVLRLMWDWLQFRICCGFSRKHFGSSGQAGILVVAGIAGLQYPPLDGIPSAHEIR